MCLLPPALLCENRPLCLTLSTNSQVDLFSLTKMEFPTTTGNFDGTHFVFILDVLSKPNFDIAALTQSLDAILAFGNSLLMQSGTNKLTILGSNVVRNTVLYLDEDSHPNRKVHYNGQQMEKFALVTSQVRSNLARWMHHCVEACHPKVPPPPQPPSSTPPGSLLSGTLAQGLCLVNRFRADFAHSRMLIFSLGSGQGDSYSSQYLTLINCFFAAQKIEVLVDACSVPLSRESEDSGGGSGVSASMEDRFAASILQQGADLTGGRYIRVHKLSTLLQHLFWCLTPSAADRPKLVLPPKLRITPPAACFCHRKVLDIGYVCSVCMSIFCQFLPYCTTCNSNVFLSSLKRIARLKSAPANITNGQEIVMVKHES